MSHCQRMAPWASGAVLPPLNGLPVAGQLPIIGSLIGGNGKLTLEAVPGVGSLLFAGSGGNLLTLSQLPAIGSILSGSGNLLSPNVLTAIILPSSSSSALNISSLLPFSGGLFGNLSNPLTGVPLLASIISAY